MAAGIPTTRFAQDREVGPPSRSDRPHGIGGLQPDDVTRGQREALDHDGPRPVVRRTRPSATRSWPQLSIYEPIGAPPTRVPQLMGV